MASTFFRSASGRERLLPLFPLATVLFPGGVLPLKVFEQRYVEMTKACLKDGRPFGVVLLTRGHEVAGQSREAPEFATVGTLATITDFDMPQLGILHLRTVGGARFQVQSHAVDAAGFAVGEVALIPDEPAQPLPADAAPLVRLLEVIAGRIGPENFPSPPRYDDATWVGHRLAELLPIAHSIKQHLLEINDASLRLAVLRRFLTEQGLLD